MIVPPNPGITSALGCLLVDLRHDLSTTYFAPFDDISMPELEAAFTKLEEDGRWLLTEEGADPAQIELQRSLDMRYVGQWRSLSIPIETPLDAEAIVQTFHNDYAREYMFKREDYPLEIHGIAVRATGFTTRPELPKHACSDNTPARSGQRQVWFAADAAIETPIYQRSSLAAGTSIAGPAVIEQLDSTTLVPPGITLEVDECLNLRMKVIGA